MSMKKEASKKQKSFYDSKAWKSCRAEYIKRVGGLCERCLTEGKVNPGHIVHHKKYIDPSNIHDPKILLNHENLEYLCMEHHNAEHFRQKRRYRVGENGAILPS